MLAGVSSRVASALVFGSSAAVLVVELTALRLLAPYLGLTLETSTIVIGTALTAIAVGSAYGGRVADLVRPGSGCSRRCFVASGLAVAMTPPVVRAAGEAGSGEGVLPAAMLAILVPGALLSAVTAGGHQAAAADPRGDRHGGGPAVRHRHGRRDRRHRRSPASCWSRGCR